MASIVARVRQEAYTGSNRCWPCTALNTALVVFVAVTLGVILSPIAAGVAFIAGVATVWLRGYLVPYTPWITSRAMNTLSDSPRGRHGTPNPRGTNTDTPTDEMGAGGIVDALSTAGVVVKDGEELSLAPKFRDAWRATIEENHPYELDAVADAIEAAIDWVATASVVRDDGREWVRLTDADDNIHNETWLAAPAAVADHTAVRTLETQTELTPDQRALVAPSLRQFLDRCPVCDERLEVTSPRACCGSPRYVAEGIDAVLNCPACDEIITIFEVYDGPA